jgi:hypothetical protein
MKDEKEERRRWVRWLRFGMARSMVKCPSSIVATEAMAIFGAIAVGSFGAIPFCDRGEDCGLACTDSGGEVSVGSFRTN